MDTFRGKYKTYYVENVRVLSANNERNTTQRSLLSSYVDNGILIESSQLRVVSCKAVLYVWNEESSQYMKVCGLDRGRKCFEFHEFKGYSELGQSIRQITYGKNEIVVPFQTILTLLALEALTPFYIFQVFSLAVWFAEGYYYYTIAIILMSLFGISSSIIQTRRNQRNLREFHSTEKVTVCRGNGEYVEISSNNLVPGDIIEIPRGNCVMQCDAVLLNGICIVNESMLTGESVPVTKTPISRTSSIYEVTQDSFHTLFCGTNVIQTRSNDGGKVFAIVLRTGYLTSKGELVRSILYPPPSDFEFDRESYKFIGVLAAIAIMGFVYTVVSKNDRSIDATDIIIKALDVFTIVIPPALPAAMTIGKLYALSRLKKQDIFCMNSRVINVSGSIDCVCFDKTGTLTEDGLEMWGVVPVTDANMSNPIRDITSITEDSDLLIGMATCHSLVIIDNQLYGDPLDIKVFESTGWLLQPANIVISAIKPEQEQDHEKYITICHCYQFVSSLQRMSVIINNSDSADFQVYSKGSPEMISSLCKTETVPSDLVKILTQFTGKGYRVLAIANKVVEGPIDLCKLKRTDIERELNFLGLIILENCLKPETPLVINELKDANLKIVMITGDNIETAVSVARESGIISNNDVVANVEVSIPAVGNPTLSFTVNKCQNTDMAKLCKNDISLECGLNFEYTFTLNGSNWALINEHFPEKIPKLLDRGAVFARMSGKQKQHLIQELQKLGYYVAMCGDGANDCGALKAAHVGISLSDEESSVASPFTSKNPNISCVPTVIKEGRAALTTSIGVFKFMICYSLSQFTSVIVLYGIDSNLTQLQFLFIDICLILNFMSLFGKTAAYEGPLARGRPLTSLLSFSCLTSILIQMLLVVFFQILAYKLVQTYDWFVPFQFNPEKITFIYSSYENYAVFSVSIFQYIILAITFSKGKPFRMPMYNNKLLLFSVLLMVGICIYIIVYPANWILVILEMVLPPNYDIICVICGLAAANFICSTFAEDIFVKYVLNNMLWEHIKRHTKSSEKSLGDGCSVQQAFDLVNADIVCESTAKGVLNKHENGYVNSDFLKSETN